MKANNLKVITGLLGTSERKLQRFRDYYKAFKKELEAIDCKDKRKALTAFINYEFKTRINNTFAIDNIIEYFEKDTPQRKRDKKEIEKRIHQLNEEIINLYTQYETTDQCKWSERSEIMKKITQKNARVEELEQYIGGEKID